MMDTRDHEAYGGHDDNHKKPRAMGDSGPDFRTNALLTSNSHDWGKNAEDVVKSSFDRPVGEGDNWLSSIKREKYYNND